MEYDDDNVPNTTASSIVIAKRLQHGSHRVPVDPDFQIGPILLGEMSNDDCEEQIALALVRP